MACCPLIRYTSLIIRFLFVRLRFCYCFFSPTPHDVNLASRFWVRCELRLLWTFTTDERHARHTHQTGNHKDCRFFRVLLAMLPTTPQAMAIFYRRRIFRSPLGSRNARRGAYMAYVSTERFTADTAVGEKDKSIWSMFSPHSCTAPTHSSPRASYRHRPVRGLCSSTLCP